MKSTKNLFIIDDALLIINHLIEILKDEPGIANIDFAVNTAEAKKYLSQTVPEIIILDINLGKENGLEFLKFLKQNYPSVHVIVFSNQTNSLYKSLAEKLGADYFLDKSSDFGRLASIIATL